MEKKKNMKGVWIFPTKQFDISRVQIFENPRSLA